MKKLFPVMLFALAFGFGVTLVSCGDDKDEPIDNPQYKTYKVNGVSFKMITVEGGTFIMGTTDEQGSDDYDLEQPAHLVALSSYSIGETEVTQALWLAVMGSTPSYFSSRNNFAENLQRPVESVSWDDCQTFIAKLNQLTGKNFRLPTEAEWEYAARGGKLSRGYEFAGSNTIDDVAWYYGNSGHWGSNSPDGGTHTVATKAPNELGLYDMTGNVLEWCQDWYGDYTNEVQTNPIGPASGSSHVGRGAGWGTFAEYCRVTYRRNIVPTYSDYGIGLRLAM